MSVDNDVSSEYTNERKLIRKPKEKYVPQKTNSWKQVSDWSVEKEQQMETALYLHNCLFRNYNSTIFAEAEQSGQTT
ncbi:unnamed protein product [Trichobilharzia regenti]|nr:unnamed protein product [Trichobilharzia regenti]